MSSETITSLSSTIVKTTEEAVKLVKTKEEIISQVNLVKGNVKLLETAIKSIIGSQEQTENPFRLEGNLALLKYYLAKLQYLLHESKVLHLKVNINNFSPLKGGTSTYVSLPDFISRKRAVINVKNNDSFCFLWAVVSARYPAKNKHPERITSYPHFKDVLKYDSIQFPIKLNDIKKFEKLNGLCINLYCIEKKNVLPLSLSEYRNSNREPINLLVLSTENSNNNSSPEFSKERTLFHFAWIKKMSALLSKQLSSHGHKTFICYRCLNHFSSDGLLKKHLIYCNNMNKCALKLPKESDKILQFKHFSYKEKVPFAIYADLESILEPCESLGADNGKTVNYQNHTAFSVAYYLKCSYDDSLSSFKLYRNHDCISWFISELKDIAFNLIAHQDCNLNYQNSFNIPVVFHNLSGYDSNFIMKHGNWFCRSNSVTPGTEVQLRFIDSYRFMSSSLDKLSSYLEDEKKTIVRAHCNTDKEFNLLTRKGVFPYDYIDSWERFTETCLPSKTNFYWDFKLSDTPSRITNLDDINYIATYISYLPFVNLGT
ncbi:hypothetical protein NQ315_014898 [Exocentrus adspersus]|uniref:DNA-directed DNA polymerase n=1 Tax=Exocentrus adspersus TaxID=1586481 RepID=A0AAV8VLR1_9CUCU|nr:hypothetical protein NQ315_014898 [Exocentrus adspersus]